MCIRDRYKMDVEKVKSIVSAEALSDDLKISNALEFIKMCIRDRPCPIHRRTFLKKFYQKHPEAPR